MANLGAAGRCLDDAAFEALAGEIEKVVGSQGFSRDPDVCESHARDWSGMAAAAPRAVVRPSSTEEVSQILRLCNGAGQPVALQGGRTGLAGGASTDAREIALSLDRMTAVGAVDTMAGTVTVDAGATLQAVQEAADDHDLFYAVDLGARGTAAIGGTIATNAGGIRVVRYGMTRAQVLGLEAVLADGTVLTDMSGIIKNNTGLDLKQLFIGSEGAFGVITRAVLKLHPKQPCRVTAWISLASDNALPEVLTAARKSLGSSLSAFEPMWPDYLDTVSRRMPKFPIPLPAGDGPAVILELLGDDQDAERQRMEAFLGGLLETGLVADAVLAETIDQERRIWAVRDEVPAEYQTTFQGMIAFDVSIPVSRMVGAVRALRAELIDRVPDADRLIYGHLGDDNLHLVLGFQQPVGKDLKNTVETLVYDLVRELGGSVSAEHGIGRWKRPWLGHTRSPAEIETMRRLKTALDPNGILNPGRILPD